jgi:type I restriction enzyme, S subunit
MKNAWQTKTLDEISTNLDSRRVPITKAVRAIGEYPYYGASGIVDYVADYIFDEDTLLISEDGANLLARSTPIAFPASGRYWVNNHAHILKFESMTTQRFVELYLESIPLDDYITGAAQPKLNQKALNSIPIPFAPLPEQHRIVSIVDEAFEGIATAKGNAEKNLQNARDLFETHLQSVFTQRGPGWVEKKLGDMCERITKGSSPKWQGIAYVEKPGILFVTSENVGEYQILLEQPKYVEEKFNTKDKKSILRKGDVLTNIVGASIGRTAVFDRDNNAANINQAVCLIRCEAALLSNYFLTYLLNSPVFKQVLHDNEVDNARANLSLGFFSQLLVPTPPLPKQREIVAKLDTLREETRGLESIYKRKLAALEALKKSLLHQAFTGQL